MWADEALHGGVVDWDATAVAFALAGEVGEDAVAVGGGGEFEAEEGASDAFAGLAVVEVTEADFVVQ